MKIFIEVESEDSADYMIDDYNQDIEKEQDQYKERILNSKVSITSVKGKPSTILVDKEDKKIGLIYPTELMEIGEFIALVRQFKDGEVFDITSMRYEVQDRLMRVGIGFGLEINR
ncbi:MAG: hypothetical protein DRI86_00910 [Bacteroidetes bacterium]|nr:MAG: hypothetical protein DRI86_00910 [Bacteroidota bacterium]